MRVKESFKKRYLELGSELEDKYPELSFRNHCYWRIALDNTLGKKWDECIARPAYQNLSELQIKEVIELLEGYKLDKKLLLQHNGYSLKLRQITPNKVDTEQLS